MKMENVVFATLRCNSIAYNRCLFGIVIHITNTNIPLQSQTQGKHPHIHTYTHTKRHGAMHGDGYYICVCFSVSDPAIIDDSISILYDI